MSFSREVFFDKMMFFSRQYVSLKHPFLGKFLGFLGIALLLISCRPTINTRGNLFDPKLLDKIVVNKTSAAEVRQILGPPTSQEMFSGKGWFYMGEQTETYAFLRPKVLERRIYRFEFTDTGLVSQIKLYDAKGYEIKADSDKTPTYGRDPSFLAEFVGNIGRYEDPGNASRKK